MPNECHNRSQRGGGNDRMAIWRECWALREWRERWEHWRRDDSVDQSGHRIVMIWNYSIQSLGFLLFFHWIDVMIMISIESNGGLADRQRDKIKNITQTQLKARIAKIPVLLCIIFDSGILFSNLFTQICCAILVFSEVSVRAMKIRSQDMPHSDRQIR